MFRVRLSSEKSETFGEVEPRSSSEEADDFGSRASPEEPGTFKIRLFPEELGESNPGCDSRKGAALVTA